MASETLFLEKLEQIVGTNYLLSEDADTAPYREEQRSQYQSQCLAVVSPADSSEISECLKTCAEHGISVVPMGGNTGLCGGTVANDSQIILSLGRLNRIRQIDTDNNSITVEAGCILADIQTAASEQRRLFPLSLGAEGSCQIGGNLSTNAGGINVLHYGNTRDLCLGIEAVMPDGSVYSDLGGLRKDNTGYALKHLLIGAEGTLGIITAATLKLFPEPRESVTALVALPNLAAVIPLYHLVRESSSDRVTTFELIPRIAVEFTARHFSEHPDPFSTPHPWLVLIMVHSTRAEPGFQEHFSDTLEQAYHEELISDALLAQNIEQARHCLALREKLVSAQKLEGASVKHDISVPISSIEKFIHRAAQAVEKICPGARPYPFGHVGDGNIHYNISQPLGISAQAFMEKRLELNNVVLDIVHELKGSFSAEHGVGILKPHLIPRYKGEVAHQLMRQIKQAIDPLNTMNPGKVVGE